MKYILDITSEESEFIWDAVCNFVDELRIMGSSTGLLQEELFQSVIDKIAEMDKTIQSSEKD